MQEEGCEMCKLILLTHANEIPYDSLCAECKKVEDLLKPMVGKYLRIPSKFYRWYRYEFGVDMLEPFEEFFVNIFAVIILYCFTFQFKKFCEEMSIIIVDLYKLFWFIVRMFRKVVEYVQTILEKLKGH